MPSLREDGRRAVTVSLRGTRGWKTIPNQPDLPDHDIGYLDYLMENKPQTIKRAKRREVMRFGDGYLVMGNSKLGDSRSQYQVQMVDGKWDCTCYHSDHGDSRSRNTCTHVVGVWLYLKSSADMGSDAQQQDEEEVEVGLPLESSQSVEEEEPPKPKKGGGKKKAKGKGNRKKKKSKAKKAKAAPRPEVTDPGILLPSHPSLIPTGWADPPEWLSEYRPHQWDAAQEAHEAIQAGARVIYLDAPTGSGKTGIADLITRMQQRRGVYLCSSKQLQDQVLGDFPYSRVLKGRANYQTINYPRSFPEITCDDCTGNFDSGDDSCDLCPSMKKCPYRVAKQLALGAQLGVLNTAYWIREANYVGGFARPAKPDDPNPIKAAGGLFIVDECDTLEDALLGFVDFRLTRRMMKTLGMTTEPPKKGSHRQTISKWIIDELVPIIAAEASKQPRSIEGERARRRLNAYLEEAALVAGEYAEDEEERWIRDNDEAPLSLKPVLVTRHGRELLWPHMGTTVMMSATIISDHELTDSLGVDRQTYTIQVPMTFPVENMPIVVAPVASMKGGIRVAKENGEADKLAHAIVRVCELHPDVRILIHTVSYDLARHIIMRVRQRINRPWFTYNDARERDQALAAYRATERAVMFAPSFDRGVDLKGDDCRVVVVAKMPKPYIGDARVKARANMPGGDEWYAVQTIRTLVQMTGRGMRSADDHCTSYILDADFMEYQRRYHSLLPKWWRAALNNRFKVRQLSD